MTGKVTILGAGLGNPELLPQKAVQVLRNADVVLHDQGVPEEALSLARPGARVQEVGTRFGKNTVNPSEIRARMVAYASEGLSVMRLKAAEALSPQHSDEETRALEACGIDFEVIPGTALAAGAPV